MIEEIKHIVNKLDIIEISEILYTSNSIKIMGIELKTDRPRYWFAIALREIESNGFWLSETKIHDSVTIGKNCSIGEAGFGYVEDEDGNNIQIPHLGGINIGRNVQIHNNVCIDRGVISDTTIGDGTKIDNLVHIAHNCKIGKRNLIAAGAIIGGSVEIGDDCFIGINSTIKQKVKIGNNCIIGAGAVVLNDVPDDTVYAGNPARFLKVNKKK